MRESSIGKPMMSSVLLGHGDDHGVALPVGDGVDGKRFVTVVGGTRNRGSLISYIVANPSP